ncbi:hypothetical protein [Kordia jejudonensis]|uniref:hypothetical protein n=1 Tax=Kordia jejudonensis TaxID=1348245 RepID=UPI000629BC3B|nr:hypothetical protein [Kordia jejudonensis]
MSSTRNNSYLKVANNAFWRFIFLFACLYIVPYDMGYSITENLEEINIWEKPAIWIGETFYGWEFDTEQLYIGYDSRFEYCRYILFFWLAFIGTCIWLLVDRFIKKKYTTKLKILVQTMLRYHVGLTILDYGLSKILMIQFGSIGIDTLELQLGSSGGMSLMWYFLSYSELMVMTAGWLEFIGGVLLLFRRTTFLGVLILIAVMANVVLMNFSYSVTVTLYASLLLFLLLVLISTQLRNFFAYVVLNQKTQAKPYEPLVKNKKVRLIFKIILISVIGYFHVKNYKELLDTYTKNRYAWFTNLQTVETFVINGDTLAPAAIENNEKAWKQLSFNGLSYYPETFRVKNGKDIGKRFKFEIDSTTQKIRFRPYFGEESEQWSELSYKKLDEKRYLFEGIYEGDTISVTTKAKLIEEYQLMKYKGKLLFDDY